MITNYFKAAKFGSVLAVRKSVMHPDRMTPGEVVEEIRAARDPKRVDTLDEDRNVAIPGWVKMNETFGFDDRDPDEIREAFEKAVVEASTRGGVVSVYRTPSVAGPWDNVPVIGVNPIAPHEA